PSNSAETVAVWNTTWGSCSPTRSALRSTSTWRPPIRRSSITARTLQRRVDPRTGLRGSGGSCGRLSAAGRNSRVGQTFYALGLANQLEPPPRVVADEGRKTTRADIRPFRGGDVHPGRQGADLGSRHVQHARPLHRPRRPPRRRRPMRALPALAPTCHVRRPAPGARRRPRAAQDDLLIARRRGGGAAPYCGAMTTADVALVRSVWPPEADMVELVDSLGDYAAAFGESYDPAFEVKFHPDGPAAFGILQGPEGMVRGWHEWLEPYASYRYEVEDYLDAGGGEVVMLVQVRAVIRRDGVAVEHAAAGAW